MREFNYSASHHFSVSQPIFAKDDGSTMKTINKVVQQPRQDSDAITNESYWGVLCGANLWFGGFPYPENPGRPEWSKGQTRGKPLVATAQATCVSAGE